MFNEKEPSKIWEQLTTIILSVIAVDVLFIIVFVCAGKTVWDLPLFHLASAILLLLSMIFYLIINRMDGITVWKKRLLFGLTAAGFAVLILTSGLYTFVALMSISE